VAFERRPGLIEVGLGCLEQGQERDATQAWRAMTAHNLWVLTAHNLVDYEGSYSVGSDGSYPVDYEGCNL